MSDSEYSTTVSCDSKSETDSVEDFGVVGQPIEPYQFEPLAEDGDQPDEDEDHDGLTPATLEARFQNQVAVNVW